MPDYSRGSSSLSIATINRDKNMEYDIKPKPTMYNGRLYRSRLEARYAAFYGLMNYEAEYEPLDLPGWSPDFQIQYRGFSSYVEVKPIKNISELDDEYIQRVVKAALPLYNQDFEIRITGIDPTYQWLLTSNKLCFNSAGQRMQVAYFVQAPTHLSWLPLFEQAANEVMFLKPVV